MSHSTQAPASAALPIIQAYLQDALRAAEDDNAAEASIFIKRALERLMELFPGAADAPAVADETGPAFAHHRRKAPDDPPAAESPRVSRAVMSFDPFSLSGYDLLEPLDELQRKRIREHWGDHGTIVADAPNQVAYACGNGRVLVGAWRVTFEGEAAHDPEQLIRAALYAKEFWRNQAHLTGTDKFLLYATCALELCDVVVLNHTIPQEHQAEASLLKREWTPIRDRLIAARELARDAPARPARQAPVARVSGPGLGRGR